MAERAPASPLVTVVIAAWNASTTIERAMRSALDQTVPVQLIVVDDASRDDTFRRAMNAGRSGGHVQVIRLSENEGPAAARNIGLERAEADWVTVLDSDDFMEPGRLEALVELATETGADFVADDLYKVPESAVNGTRRRLCGDRITGTARLEPAGFIEGNLSSRYGGRQELGFLKPLMSRHFLERHRLRYDADIRLGEDYVLYARALLAGADFRLTEPLGYVAVVRDGSLSSHHPKEAHERLIAADRALLAMPGVRGPEGQAVRRALRAHLLEQRKRWAWRALIDAVKAEDPSAALACFWAPPQVGADLLRRLGNEALERLSRRMVPR